jgi:hypothetical protein
MISNKEIHKRIKEAQKLSMTIPEYMIWFREHYQPRKFKRELKDLLK